MGEPDRVQRDRARKGALTDISVLKRQIPHWLLSAVATGVLVVGLAVAWGVILRVNTANGTIDLVNLPKDAEVFVDGEKFAVPWLSDGTPAMVWVTAGKHRITVRKDGLATSGDEVTEETIGAFFRRLNWTDTDSLN